MPEIASHCSERERNATDAERETDLIKKIEFMLDHVGEEFDGVISGVTGFGVFVELDNSVEGMIHVSYLTDDYYHYHEKLHALIGERTRRVFRLGDRLRIQVMSANKEQLTLEFGLVANLEEVEGRKELEVAVEQKSTGSSKNRHSHKKGKKNKPSSEYFGTPKKHDAKRDKKQLKDIEVRYGVKVKEKGKKSKKTQPVG